MIPVLARLWGHRLLWLSVTIVIAFFVCMLPTGYSSYGTIKRLGRVDDGPNMTIPKLTQLNAAYPIEPTTNIYNSSSLHLWSVDLYKKKIDFFFARIRNGELFLVTNIDTRNPTLVPVFRLIREKWWTSFSVLAAALAVGGVIGVLAGVRASMSRRFRSFTVGLSVAGLSVPDFLLVQTGWAFSFWTFRQWGIRPFDVTVADGSSTFALPFVVLCILPMTYIARFTLNALDEVKAEDYIRTAHAKGVTHWRVIARHALRNAIPRILNGLPTLVTIMIGSMVLLEYMYKRDGIGNAMLTLSSAEGMAVMAVVLCVFTVIMEGLAQTARILANPLLQEVAE